MASQVDCAPDNTAVKQVCHDQVLLAIRTDSNTLNSALSFSAGKTYYLISKWENENGRREKDGERGEGEREREERERWLEEGRQVASVYFILCSMYM
jgi:hypothetical protein